MYGTLMNEIQKRKKEKEKKVKKGTSKKD